MIPKLITFFDDFFLIFQLILPTKKTLSRDRARTIHKKQCHRSARSRHIRRINKNFLLSDILYFHFFSPFVCYNTIYVCHTMDDEILNIVTDTRKKRSNGSKGGDMRK